jgi:hypothetical protein
VNELLRERTLASREGALEYLATAAALQQFKQTALAYTLMSQLSQAQAAQLQQGRLQQQEGAASRLLQHGGAPQQQEVLQGEASRAAGEGEGGARAVWWTPEQLAVTAEALLEQQLGLQVGVEGGGRRGGVAPVLRCMRVVCKEANAASIAPQHCQPQVCTRCTSLQTH